MHTFTPPVSDLVADGHPYRARLDLDAHPSDARIRLRIARSGEGSPAKPLEWEAALDPASGARRWRVVLEAAALAPGEYAGELRLVVAGVEGPAWPVRFFRLPERPRPAIPFGIYAVPYPDDPAGMDETLALIRQTGIDLLCMHMNGTKQDAAFLDRAARQGLAFCPSSNLNRDAAGAPVEWEPGLRIAFAPGAPDGEHAPACFNRPEVRQRAVAAFAEMVRQYVAHPAFGGRIYYGDDLFMLPRNALGRSWISCYCPRCREGFRAAHGTEPPVETGARRGVVPADDPWLAWNRYRCRDVYGGFVAALAEAGKAAAPEAALGLCHGWPDNPFTSVATGIYTPLTQRATAAVSSYAYPFLRSPASDFICHYEFGRMNNRDKPVWMLGLFLADGVLTPDWQITQNYWNMLAAGYAFIAFFSWWNYAGDMKNPDPLRREQTRHALSVLARCGAHKDWILPAAAFWRRPPARAAALYSFATEAFDIQPVNRHHRHMKETCRLYRNALARRTALELVCEEEVLDGALDCYEALCLHDVRVLPDDVHARVQAFADRGGLVLVEPDLLYADPWHPGMQVAVRGAVELTPESMAQVLADRFPEPFGASNPDVTVRRFTSGCAEYFVLANNFPDRYHGMTYTYGDAKSENDRRAALVRSEPVSTTFGLAGERRFLFDLSTGESLGDTMRPLALDLEPAWGRVLMALPCESVALAVEGLASVRRGQRACFRIRAVDGRGDPVDAAFTARVTVTAPDGREDARGGFLGFCSGNGEFVCLAGINEQAGEWCLSVEGGFPRRVVTVPFRVEPGSAPSAAAFAAEPVSGEA